MLRKWSSLLVLFLLLPTLAFGQVTPVKPVGSTLAPLYPNAFASADNIAAQTATAIHGLTYIWDGSTWDRWTGAVSQAGTWNITNISGTVSLPTGAATEATLGTLLLNATYTGRMPAGASPADNESNTNTALSRIGTFNYVFDGAAWDRWTGAVTQSGTWNITNISGTISLPTGAATAALQDGIIKDGAGDTTQANVSSGRVHVDGSGVTQPVSGTVTANAGSGTFTVSGTTFDGIVKDGTGDTTQANVSSGRLHTAGTLTDGTDTASVTAAGRLEVECGNCSGSGASHVDDAAFTGATDDVAPVGFLYDATPPSITDGNAGIARMDSNRLAYSRPFDGTNLMPMMDAAARAGFQKITDGTDTANVSGTGKLEVTCDNCGGSSFADNSAFSFGSTNVMPLGFVFDDAAPNAVTENNAATPRMSANRVPYGILRDAAGNERGANVNASNELLVAATGTVTANAGTNLNTSALFLDATYTGRMPAGASPADNESNTNTALSRIGTFNFCFDGTTWDRCRGTLVDTDDNTIASAQATSLIVGLPYLFNGSDWKRQLGAANGLNSTGDGLNTAQMIGQFDDTTPTSITENSFGNLRISANRNLFSTLRDAAGNERGANVNASNALLVTQTGELPAGTQNIGDVDIASFPDNEPFNVAQFGGSAVVTGTGASGSGIPRVTIANDSSLAANQSVNQNQRGGTAVVAGRCEREEPIYVSIDQTTNTQLVTGTASERIYICSFHVNTATAQNVALVDGTGSTCGTGTAGVEGFGGATAGEGWNFAANGGIVLPATTQAYGRTTTNADNLCLFQSGAGQVSGGLTYVSLAP